MKLYNCLSQIVKLPSNHSEMLGKSLLISRAIIKLSKIRSCVYECEKCSRCLIYTTNSPRDVTLFVALGRGKQMEKFFKEFLTGQSISLQQRTTSDLEAFAKSKVVSINKIKFDIFSFNKTAIQMWLYKRRHFAK